MFPICYRGESTYQTIMMKNNSSLPAVFKIQINPLTQAHTGAESGMYVYECQSEWHLWLCVCVCVCVFLCLCVGVTPSI